MKSFHDTVKTVENGDGRQPADRSPDGPGRGAASAAAVTSGPADDAKIRVRGVTRSFASPGRPAVHALGPVDVELRAGEFVSVVGPSGCGKSTLLRVVAGLLPPTEGAVDVVDVDPGSSWYGFVPQATSAYPWKTVRDNVSMGLDFSGRLSKDERRRVVDHWLATTGLSAFADVLPSALSGGMRQRMAIARALAVDPTVLLMDEPFAALDAQMRVLLQDELVALWERDRRTVLFITHSIEEALILSDRVLLCSARPGRITREFPVPFARPRRHELRGTAEFAAMHEEIWVSLKAEVAAQVSENQKLDLTRSRRRLGWRKK